MEVAAINGSGSFHDAHKGIAIQHSGKNTIAGRIGPECRSVHRFLTREKDDVVGGLLLNISQLGIKNIRIVLIGDIGISNTV